MVARCTRFYISETIDININDEKKIESETARKRISAKQTKSENKNNKNKKVEQKRTKFKKMCMKIFPLVGEVDKKNSNSK